MIKGFVGLFSVLAITANAYAPALEDANKQEPKQNFISESYIVAHSIPTIEIEWNYPKLPEKLFDGDNGECVNYARTLSGIYGIRGNAKEWKDKVNSKQPSIGSIVVFEFGHLGVVFKINYLTRTIWITERNYVGLWIVSERKLKMDDESIYGYVVKDKVNQAF